MAKQKLIIIMTRTQISAAFLENGKPAPVSFDGNTKMSYEGEKDFQKFCLAVSDTFNLENLDGADMSAILVVCGSENEKANELNSLLSKLQDNSMIRAEYVLPYILASRGELKKDAGQCVAILDSAYILKNNEKNLLECAEAEKSEENALTLSAQDFIPLFSADMSKFGVDEAELQEKNKIIAEFEGLTKELQEELLSAREELNASLKPKENTLKEHNETLKKLLCIQSRYVVHWDYKPKENRSYSYPWGSSASASANMRFEFERTHKDGDAVRHGEEIGTVKVFHGKATVKYEEIFSLKAHSSGVIFYQIDNSPDIGVKAIVAVICDENDTKTEVSKWVQSVLPNYLP